MFVKLQVVRRMINILLPRGNWQSAVVAFGGDFCDEDEASYS